MAHKVLIIAVSALLSLFLAGNGHAYIIDFEGLLDLESVTNQYSSFGLTFANTTVLTSGAVGGSLNEIDFPPHSGVNVVSDFSLEGDVIVYGPIQITFANPVTYAGGYFTYNTQITLTAYDSSNNQLGTVNSSSSANYASVGIPNEFIYLNVADISRVVIAGSATGGSFTLDDFTNEPRAVPEPATLLLLGGGLLGLAGIRLLRKG